jgi:hypothetical protein
MNKTFGFLLVVAVAVGIIPYARSLESPAPPPGVAADHWISMGDAAGFVITGNASDPKNGFKSGGSDQVRGYFLIRQGHTWSRIDTAPDVGIYQTGLAK